MTYSFIGYIYNITIEYKLQLLIYPRIQSVWQEQVKYDRLVYIFFNEIGTLRIVGS